MAASTHELICSSRSRMTRGSPAARCVLSNRGANLFDRGCCWGWEGDAIIVHHLIHILAKYHKTSECETYLNQMYILVLTLRMAGMIASINVQDWTDLGRNEHIIPTMNRVMTYVVQNI
jgi:hypothetical protein